MPPSAPLLTTAFSHAGRSAAAPAVCLFMSQGGDARPVEPDAPAAPPAAPTSVPPGRRPATVYLKVLTWAFTLFNSARAIAYLPTLWAIYTSGDSSQHSLWTWGIWLGANATMAAWLYEQNGGHLNRAVVVNIANACMCLITTVLIVVYRL